MQYHISLLSRPDGFWLLNFLLSLSFLMYFDVCFSHHFIHKRCLSLWFKK